MPVYAEEPLWVPLVSDRPAHEICPDLMTKIVAHYQATAPANCKVVRGRVLVFILRAEARRLGLSESKRLPAARHKTEKALR